MYFAIGIFCQCPMTLMTLSVGRGPGNVELHFIWLAGRFAIMQPRRQTGRRYPEILPTLTNRRHCKQTVAATTVGVAPGFQQPAGICGCLLEGCVSSFLAL